MPAADPMDQHDESPGLDDPTAASETTLDSSNPRKRKKSSRACDYCHINHQPCDNAKPRCGYCERHGKNCLYLRPQKKRGPAQGYRSALYSMRESAAAWGAVLHLVPSLAPVIEGYFKKEDGKRLIRAIKDPQQQEFYIQTWQQSSVFKTFFGDDSPCDDLDQDSAAQPTGTTAPPEEAVANHAEQFQTQSQPQQQAHELQHQQQHQQHQHHQQHHQQHYQQQQSVQNSIPMPPTHQPSSHSIAPAAPSPTGRTMTPGTSGGAIGGTGGTGLGLHPMQMQFGMPPGPSQSSIPPPSLPPRQAADPSPSSSSTLFPPLPQAPSSSLPYDPKLESLLHHSPQNGPPIQPLGGDMAVLGAPTVSLSDILARAAAQPSTNFSQALGSLGFAPEETLNDFVAMSYNPDLLDGNIDTDPLLGSDLDQKAYYELLMGRRYA